MSGLVLQPPSAAEGHSVTHTLSRRDTRTVTDTPPAIHALVHVATRCGTQRHPLHAVAPAPRPCPGPALRSRREAPPGGAVSPSSACEALLEAPPKPAEQEGRPGAPWPAEHPVPRRLLAPRPPLRPGRAWAAPVCPTPGWGPCRRRGCAGRTALPDRLSPTPGCPPAHRPPPGAPPGRGPCGWCRPAEYDQGGGGAGRRDLHSPQGAPVRSLCCLASSSWCPGLDRTPWTTEHKPILGLSGATASAAEGGVGDWPAAPGLGSGLRVLPAR